MPNTAYAKCGDLSIAYQVIGQGSMNLVVAGSFVSHVELMWTSPEIKAFFDHLSRFTRVLVFDKAGVGLSDPVPKVPTLEERAREIEAVMDAAGFERAALLGLSEGGPAAMVFAATRPDRVSALLLMGTYAGLSLENWSDLDDPDGFRDHIASALGAEYSPTDQQIRRLAEFVHATRDEWGTGEALTRLLPSVRKEQLAMFERMSASPGMARATLEAAFRIDVRSVLAGISAPTLVVHASDDFVPVQFGRHLAQHIPGATMLEVEGVDHAPWLTEPDRILAQVELFLTGARQAAPTRRGLRTVLFTDIVASTQRAAATGDERWRAVLEHFDDATRTTVERFDGQVIKSTGDGHLATLDGPAQAIRCAEAIRSEAEQVGVGVRIGIHTGECELMDGDIGGLAVHIAARVMAAGAGGEILTSSTVRDLVVGSGIGFDDRGSHELKGVPGTWQLLAVRPDGASVGSPEAALIAHETPPASTGMRRSDRVAASVARRAPGLLRGLSRLADRKATRPRPGG